MSKNWLQELNRSCSSASASLPSNCSNVLILLGFCHQYTGITCQQTVDNTSLSGKLQNNKLFKQVIKDMSTHTYQSIYLISEFIKGTMTNITFVCWNISSWCSKTLIEYRWIIYANNCYFMGDKKWMRVASSRSSRVKIQTLRVPRTQRETASWALNKLWLRSAEMWGSGE